MPFKRYYSMLVEIKDSNNISKTIEAIEIEKLRCAFQIKRYYGFSSNTAQIRIWNLAERTRNKLNYFNDTVTFFAGYENSNVNSVVFSGTTTFINHKYTFPDIISNFECNAGELILVNRPIVFSVSEKISIKSIFQRVASLCFLNINIQCEIPNWVYLKGFCFAGPANEVLNNLSNKCNISWNVLGDELILVPRFSASTEGLGVPYEISEDNGMIGFPERSSYRSRYLENGGYAAGYKVKTTLLPQINPGRSVRIRSKALNINQQFYVVTATHIGDTHGELWQSEFELMQEGTK